MKSKPLEILKLHSQDNIGKGSSEEEIIKLERLLNIKIPAEYRTFLKEVGYAEIFGDEIYSIYEINDIPNLGIYFQNKDSEELKQGFLRFFSNDIDGTFFINLNNFKIYLNSIDDIYSNSFNEFIVILINS